MNEYSYVHILYLMDVIMMHYDVIIIGAGQAGLSMGYHLKKSNLSFLILDKANEIGEVWRNRYDSLTLFSSREYSSLPGMTFKGSKDEYPTKDEVADYLSSYAVKFSLPIQFSTVVQKLQKNKDIFLLSTNQGIYTSRNIIVATGAFQTPLVPDFSKFLSSNVSQIHSSQYKNQSQLNEGSVLVVGGGNSGAQIAVELSIKRKVYLSVGKKIKYLPQKIGNKDIFWWFDKLGVLKANIYTKIGQFLSKRPDPIFGYKLKSLIKNGKIDLKSRTQSINDDFINFEDDTRIKVNNVIWSTGFKPDYSWIEIENIVDVKDYPNHKRGVTSVKGLYFLGLPWQFRRGSALLYGVGSDAEYLFHKIAKLN